MRSTRNILFVVCAALFALVLTYAVVSTTSDRNDAHADPVDYRITIYANPDPGGECRIVAIDERPLIGRASFTCPGGQKIGDMLEGDKVFAEGNPVTDGVYTVGRVTFTDLGERPDIGPNTDLALVTSYAGQRYWVLAHR